MRSSSGRVLPAMVRRRLPRSASLSWMARICAGRAACTAARATKTRACGVVAASTARAICPGGRGWKIACPVRPTFRRLAGSAETTPFFFAQANSDRAATRVL